MTTYSELIGADFADLMEIEIKIRYLYMIKVVGLISDQIDVSNSRGCGTPRIEPNHQVSWRECERKKRDGEIL